MTDMDMSWTERCCFPLVWYLVFSALHFHSAVAQGGCSAFPEEPEENYSQEFSNVYDEAARPLGYLSRRVIYNGDPNENPCFTISGQDDQQIEINFETIPESLLCFDDGRAERCDMSRYQYCGKMLGSSATIRFSCNKGSGCAEGDVRFWVRITKGPTPAEDPEDDWCMFRNPEFPQDLLDLPNDDLVEVDTGSDSAGSRTVTHPVTCIITLLAALTVFH